MKRSYFYKNGVPIKVYSGDMGNTIDDTKTGWIYVDLTQFVKPTLEKIDNEWQVIESATNLEIEQFNLLKQKNKVDEFVKMKKNDGFNYANEVDRKIANIMFDKPLSEVESLDVEFRVLLSDIVQNLRNGDWITAMNLINDKEVPDNTIVADLFIEIKEYINNYVIEKYPNK